MSSEDAIFQNLYDAVLSFDADAAVKAANTAVKMKINPVKAIEKGLAKGLREVGERFEAGELWLPHLVLGAEALEAAVKVLEDSMPMTDLTITRSGTVVIGTVESDIHDLGLRIVASMLGANGFKVYDLGCDTPTHKFIEKAKEVNADIIAVSSLMTTTMPFMKDLIEALDAAGIREKYKIMVGGGPVSEEWAKMIEADGYGRDAAEAVKIAYKLMEKET